MPGLVDVTSLAIRLERVAGQVDAHIAACEASNAITASALKRVADKMDSFEKLPMQAVRWLGTIIGGAAAVILAQNFVLHQESTAKATQAATEAAVAAGNTNQVLGVVKSIKATQSTANGP